MFFTRCDSIRVSNWVFSPVVASSRPGFQIQDWSHRSDSNRRPAVYEAEGRDFTHFSRVSGRSELRSLLGGFEGLAHSVRLRPKAHERSRCPPAESLASRMSVERSTRHPNPHADLCRATTGFTRPADVPLGANRQRRPASHGRSGRYPDRGEENADNQKSSV